VGADCGRFCVCVPSFRYCGWSPCHSVRSFYVSAFAEIVARLNVNRFEIMMGVDSDEVSTFVSQVESSEQAGERELTKALQILASHDSI
jgi:hypothetical protein